MSNGFAGPIITIGGGITVANSLVTLTKSEGRHAQVLLMNSIGYTQKLEERIWLGHATEFKVIEAVPSQNDDHVDCPCTHL